VLGPSLAGAAPGQDPRHPEGDEPCQSERLQNVSAAFLSTLAPEALCSTASGVWAWKEGERKCDFVAYRSERRWGSPYSQWFVSFPHLLQNIMLIIFFSPPLPVQYETPRQSQEYEADATVSL